MRVLVGGSTGYLGGFVACELNRRGHAVRALTRDAARLGPVARQVRETFVGRVTEPSSIAGCCDGIDVVFSSIGITRQHDGLTYHDVDFAGNAALLDEAVRAGVRRFVYVSVFDPPALERLAIVCAKHAFVERLRASGIDHAVLRPTGYFSDMDAYLAMARRGRAYVFGDGGFRINPIHGADLAVACADAVEGGPADVPIGGPDVLTHEAIARDAFAAVRRTPRITHVPVVVRKALRGLARTLTPERVHGPVDFLLTVLGTDIVAPCHGRRRLADHFLAAVARDARS